MEKEKLLQLTNNLYRLTLLFPKKEPLRYKIREKAADILAKPNSDDLEILDDFFEIAQNQNWVSPSDILAIREEYGKLRSEISESETQKETSYQEPVSEEGSPEKAGFSKAVVSRYSLNPRQEKILAFLRQHERAQVGYLQQLFGDVSKRTLRRDFDNLLQQGIVERVGIRNDTYYQLKS